MGFFGAVKDNLSGKTDRRNNALLLAGKLQDLGIDDPATINKTVDNYVNTGMLVLPTTQESRVNMGDGSVQQKGRTTISDLGTTEVSTVPVQLGKQFGVYNEDTGEGSMVPGLQGAGQVLTVKAPNPNRSGMIYAYTNKVYQILC
jgi:archaellum component FlaG (FlaF/FlaG flagellin family)